jgi:large subunit ribosomal protein L21
VYAIIEDGGKQYKVEPGESVCIETRPLSDDQQEIEFDRVLFYRDDDVTLVGQPVVEGAKVTGKISGSVAGPKLYPVHFRRRKDSQRRVGHRQKYLQVEITAVSKP